MHGLSSSGQTTFVEPLTIIDQNNEMVRLREEEEISRSLASSSKLRGVQSDLSGIAAVSDALSENRLHTREGKTLC